MIKESVLEAALDVESNFDGGETRQRFEAAQAGFRRLLDEMGERQRKAATAFNFYPERVYLTGEWIGFDRGERDQ